MTLKERLSAEETDIGKFLVNYGGKGLAAVAAVGELVNFMNLMPADLVIPNVLRYIVWACAAVSFVVGKSTAKSLPEDHREDSLDKPTEQGK